MYKIIDEKNDIEKVNVKSFNELSYRERDNLQEWIAKNPDVFSEELLIIQKEFDGFHDTNERLDLLALDKQGNLVVIENKLDDSGRDVIWQVLKYASYCSSLTKEHIKDIFENYLNKNSRKDSAEDVLSDFFDGQDYDELQLNMGNSQRIIMVAAKFRKEITSTALWLMNYKLRIQCFKVTPYQMGDDKYINFEQIIPVKDVEDYVISMADKSQSDISSQTEMKTRHIQKLKFWRVYLDFINKKIDLYQNVNPSKDSYISGGTGISGIGFNSVISKKYARVEIYISRNLTEENKIVFDKLFERKNEIEEAFCGNLEWERLDGKKASRIKAEKEGIGYDSEDDWQAMIEFMTDSMERLVKAAKGPLKDVRVYLGKNGEQS